METWATFSIIDHRKPVYRQALALFDRIVVPVPGEPIGDQTREELDRLTAEVTYLAQHGAAELVEWDSDSFQDWRRPLLAAAVASKINRDPFQDTRLMLVEKLEHDGVQAVPVFGGREEFTRAKNELGQVEEAVTTEIMQRLPVPDYDTPLENLVRLRQKPAFRDALANLLEWKQLKVPAVVLAADRAAAMTAAMRELDKLTRAYAKAMESEGYNKAGTIGSIFFSLITGQVVGAIKEGLVAFRELREPCWKKVSQMKCAPGGVIYQFTEAMK